MSDALPDPLVPPEVDLRTFGFMPLHVQRLRDSDLAALSTGDEFKAAVLLWAAAWHQQPAGSLPADDRVLWKFAGTHGPEEWLQVRDGALRGFVRCSDGRLYHPTIADVALDAWERREDWQEKRADTMTRQQRWRAQLSHLSELLRGAGVTPPMRPTKAQLIELCRKHVDGFVDADVDGGETQGVSRETSTCRRGETAKTGTGTGTGTGRAPRGGAGARAGAGAGASRARAREASPTPAGTSNHDPDPPGETPSVYTGPRRGTPPPDGKTVDMPPPEPDPGPPPAPPPEPSLAGAVCLAMRRAGLASTNPGDPRLLALLNAGTTTAEFAGMAAEAAAKGKGWAWCLVTLDRRRGEAASMGHAPGAPPPPPAGRSAVAETDELLAQMARDRAAAKSPESRAARERAMSTLRQRKTA